MRIYSLIFGLKHPYKMLAMPKMKTKAAAKKRFRLTASGLVKFKHAGKRHNLIKRTSKVKRKARLVGMMKDSDTKILRSMMPYQGVR